MPRRNKMLARFTNKRKIVDSFISIGYTNGSFGVIYDEINDSDAWTASNLNMFDARNDTHFETKIEGPLSKEALETMCGIELDYYQYKIYMNTFGKPSRMEVN